MCRVQAFTSPRVTQPMRIISIQSMFSRRIFDEDTCTHACAHIHTYTHAHTQIVCYFVCMVCHTICMHIYTHTHIHTAKVSDRNGHKYRGGDRDRDSFIHIDECMVRLMDIVCLRCCMGNYK